MKKILLIGASSDICKQLYKDFTPHYEFLLLSSDKEESDYENFDILNRQTYPEISDIDGIVYFPGTINLKPFERFRASLSSSSNFFMLSSKIKLELELFSRFRASSSSSSNFLAGFEQARARARNFFFVLPTP